MKKSNPYILPLSLIFLAGLALRLLYIQVPLLETVPTRQLETAAIARNFYGSYLNIFYPKFDHLGDFRGYVVMEFGLLPFLTACLYKLVGGVHEWLGRLISVAFSCGSMFMLYRFGSVLYNRKAGVWVAFCFFFSPLSIIYSRTFQPESMMIFFTICSLFFCYRWFEEPRRWRLLGAIICGALAILLKITAAYILMPIAYLFWQREKSLAFIKNYQLWFVYSMILIAPFMWYLRGSMLTRWIGSTYGQINWSLSQWFSLETLLSFKSLGNFLEYSAGKMLTPIGVFFLVRALYKQRQEKHYPFLLSWLMAVLIYMVAFCNTALGHKYYYLPLLVISSLFIGIEVSKPYAGFRKPWARWIKYLVVFLLAGAILGQLRTAYFLDDRYRFTKQAGEKLDEIAPASALVLATRRMYYCNRKGWRFHLTRHDQSEHYIERLEDFRSKGASHFVVNYMPPFLAQKELVVHMRQRYSVLHEQEEFMIFDLASKGPRNNN